MRLMVHGVLVAIQVRPLLRHALYTDKKRFQSTLRLYRHAARQAAYITPHHRHEDVRGMLISCCATFIAGNTTASAAGNTAVSPACYILHIDSLVSGNRQPVSRHRFYTVKNRLPRQQERKAKRYRHQVLRFGNTLESRYKRKVPERNIHTNPDQCLWRKRNTDSYRDKEL